MLHVLFFLFLAVSVKGDLIEECMNYTIYPLQYELTIMPYVSGDGSYYYCDITIDVIANAPDIRVIELDAKDLVIRQGTIKVLSGRTDIVNGARPYEYDQRNGKLYIHLREALRRFDVRDPSNQFVYKIQMSFTKYVNEDSPGIFLVKYYDERSREYKYMLTTRFSLNKAKYAFPCFDNPRFEAGFKFKVYVLPQRNDIQYTNTSIVISEVMKVENLTNYHVINYRPSPQVALHQLGIHLSQFTNMAQISQNANDSILVWAPSNTLDQYVFIQTFGIQVINLINRFSKTNRPFLNGPINLIAVPRDLDGYEIASWNLLTNSATRIANIQGLTSIKQIERMEFELAQQLSRIWLGNPGEPQVTRWREEWFKEGMATYLAYYVLAQFNYGYENIRSVGAYGLEIKRKAMAADWHHSTPALINFNNTLAVEIPSRYKELVTMKTAAIWWMLESWFEANQLHQSLVRHINAMRGQYISLWDLMAAIDKDTIECTYQFFNGSTPSRILRSWFQQPGYPVVYVNVLRDRNPNAIQLKQRHFSYTSYNREPTDFLIPITYFVQKHDTCINCQKPRFTIAETYTFSENVNGGWILLNKNASGYYRINYDKDTWRLIAKSLQQDPMSINEMNRAQTVNDIFALYMAGDIDRLLAEEVLEYLDKEPSQVVWEAVIDGFDMLRIDGARTQMTKYVFWEWQEFLAKKLQPVFYALVNNRGQHPVTRMFRYRIVNFAADVNYEPCSHYLRGVREEYRQGLRVQDEDIREAGFYVFENQTSSFIDRELHPIELDDKIAAQSRVRERNRFLMRLPYGEPRPLPIISTGKPQPLPQVVTDNYQGLTQGSVAVQHFSSIALIGVAFLMLLM